MAKTVRKSYRKKAQKKSYKKRNFKRYKKRTQDDPTVQTLNVMRQPKPIRVNKSTRFNLIGQTSVVNTCGLQWISTTGSSAVIGQRILFDPSGTFGNNSGGYFNGSVSISPGPLAIASGEWTNFANLYQFYKVNKITLVFNATGITTGNPTLLYIVRNRVFNGNTPSLANIADFQNVVQKTFTQDHPQFKYSFRPNVQVLTDNEAVLASEGRTMKLQGWTSINNPVELYGIDLLIGAMASNTGLYMDIEYDVSFKGVY